MDQTEDGAAPLEVSRFGITDRPWWCERKPSQLIQTSVRTMLYVVDYVLGQDSLQMSTTKDQHMVEALTADCADEALSERIGSGSPHRGADDPDAVGSEDLVDTRGDLGISVSNEELDTMGLVLQRQGQVPRLLDNPWASRMSGDPGHIYPSCVELNEEEHVEAL